jgi:hypothetical protein
MSFFPSLVSLTPERKLHCSLRCLPLSSKNASDCFFSSFFVPEYLCPPFITYLDVSAHQFLDGPTEHQFLIFNELFLVKQLSTDKSCCTVFPVGQRALAHLHRQHLRLCLWVCSFGTTQQNRHFMQEALVWHTSQFG